MGNKGNDLLSGNDFLSGNAGEYNHPVKDTRSGGDGNDVFGIDNDHAGKDVVTCGGGFDWVFADGKDAVAPNTKWATPSRRASGRVRLIPLDLNTRGSKELGRMLRKLPGSV